MVAIIALWLDDLLGRQVGVPRLLQGGSVRRDRDLEGGHHRSHILGSGDSHRRQVGWLGWGDLHHGSRNNNGGRWQVGRSGWLNLDDWGWGWQVHRLGGPHNRDLGLHSHGRQVNRRWWWRRTGHWLGRQVSGRWGHHHARGNGSRRQVLWSWGGQLKRNVRGIVVVAWMIVVLVAQEMGDIGGHQSQTANGQNKEFLEEEKNHFSLKIRSCILGRVIHQPFSVGERSCCDDCFCQSDTVSGKCFFIYTVREPRRVVAINIKRSGLGITITSTRTPTPTPRETIWQPTIWPICPTIWP